MPIAQNQETLDYASTGSPWLSTLAKNSIDPDGLDLTYGGAPFYASLGVVSLSILRATQDVIEVIRWAGDPGGGGLRATQAIREVIYAQEGTVVTTQQVIEVLRVDSGAIAAANRLYGWNIFRPDDQVEVRLRFGTLASATTELDVLNGENLAMLGDELLQFRDVQDLGGDRYILSHLLRGRFGTEWAMPLHKAGEPFVLLAPGTFHRILHETDDIDKIRYYKAVSVGMSLNTTFTRPFINTGRSLLPYAPCHISSSRDGSNNLTINWIRRTRTGGEWRDYVEVPIGETTEAYEIDIINPGTGAVVRTLTSTTPTVVYSAANQTTDFGSPQPLVVATIYQMSEAVGRGYGTQKNV